MEASKRFINEEKIKILQGDSSEQLTPICKSIEEPSFFWLDGHWSGGNTAQGAKDCPLFEELSQIMEYFKPKCIIAIDDVRLFGTKNNEDWSNITRENILNIVGSRLDSCKYFPSYLYPEDRMVIVLKSL